MEQASQSYGRCHAFLIITFNSQASLIQLKIFSDALCLHSLRFYIKSKIQIKVTFKITNFNDPLHSTF
jgi:hypothetical protein